MSVYSQLIESVHLVFEVLESLVYDTFILILRKFKDSPNKIGEFLNQKIMLSFRWYGNDIIHVSSLIQR